MSNQIRIEQKLSIRSPFAIGIVICLCAIFCQSALAQGPLMDAPQPQPSVPSASPFVSVTPSVAPVPHKFWDRENEILFAATAAMNVADFTATRANLQNGGTELNPVVRMLGRSTPALALNFAGETAGVIGVTYFLHKTGHHKLERITSVVNLSASSLAVGYGFSHR